MRNLCWSNLVCLAMLAGCSTSDGEGNREGCLDTTCPSSEVCVETDGVSACGCPPETARCELDGLCYPATTPCGEATADSNPECEPGEQRCYDAMSLDVCSDEGQWVQEPCPEGTSRCEDGVCIPWLCVPYDRTCMGVELWECESDGMAWAFVETCMGDCVQDVCEDPCGHHVDKISYLGCTFWAVNLENAAQNTVDAFALTVSSNGNLPIDISVFSPADELIETATVDPGELVTLPLTSLGQLSGTGVTQQSYRLETTGRVTVHQFNPINDIDVHSSDASLLLPLQGIGTDYRVMSWPTQFVYLDLVIPCATDSDCTLSEAQSCDESVGRCQGPVDVEHSQVVIVAASHDTTEVSIDSPVDFEVTGESGATTIYPVGQSALFSLTRGAALTLATTAVDGADLTGMRVSTSAEVAVFSSSSCAMIPFATYACDHLEQQLMPTNTWGTKFVGAKFSPRGTEPDVWRVLAHEQATTLTTTPSIAGVDGVTLQPGSHLEFEWSLHFLLQASSPISVAQYMVGADYPGPDGGCSSSGLFPSAALDRDNCAIEASEACAGHQAIGDPAFLLSVPTSQFRERYTVLVPADYAETYLTLIEPAETSVLLDGVELTSSAESIGDGAWAIRTLAVESGVHEIEADRAIGLSSYGYDCTVSYAYPGGLNLVPAE